MYVYAIKYINMNVMHDIVTRDANSVSELKSENFQSRNMMMALPSQK